jgi:hypothetical protein
MIRTSRGIAMSTV